ncbi:hypothetical protein CWO91_16870 [Bradyrhizobium genosp. SA-3]|uniref:hypothetical protein n=1 Tax=Bradyrhizobium genosp. SA-3 TaxID=508868 RepID=UPI001029E2F2|nr:hypothetical protein [Bradyrhizobium genosp. SA-3]RZN09701.1 hypothetical protein CWO91_16870 [Bradyrhizobium genosp. SA-3]
MVDYRGILRAAETATVDPSLPEKTQREQEAGRARIMQNLRASVVDVGMDELQRRFGKRSVPTGGLRFVAEANRWMVDVVVHTAARRVMQFEDELLEFPSDHMIAQVALVV